KRRCCPHCLAARGARSAAGLDRGIKFSRWPCVPGPIYSSRRFPRETMVDEHVESDPRVAALEDRTLMVLDDDAPFRARLARALAQRGFDVIPVGSVAEARDHLKTQQPAFAVVDLRLEDGSGLEVVEALQRSREDSHAVILTGYG